MLPCTGHNCVWHNQLPAWVEAGNFDNATLLSIIETHCGTLVGHYAGQMYAPLSLSLRRKHTDVELVKMYVRANVFYLSLLNFQLANRRLGCNKWYEVTKSDSHLYLHECLYL